jgi:hypothetical protein
LVSRLRDELGAPELPILIGDLAPFGDSRRKPEAVARRALVRAGLRRVADEDPHAAFVESLGLGGCDGVHFDRAALVELGHRYAEAFLDFRR